MLDVSRYWATTCSAMLLSAVAPVSADLWAQRLRGLRNFPDAIFVAVVGAGAVFCSQMLRLSSINHYALIIGLYSVMSRGLFGSSDSALAPSFHAWRGQASLRK